MSSSRSQAYTDAGVNINAGNELVSRIKSLVASTRIPGVVSDIGGFGGLFRPELEGMKTPVLVSSTDGVGTKLKLAALFDRHDTVGIDLVAMSVNDILVQGAKPLFFLDYFATGELNVEQAEADNDQPHNSSATESYTQSFVQGVLGGIGGTCRSVCSRFHS